MNKPQLTPTAFTRYYTDVSRTSMIPDAETEKTLIYLYRVKRSREARKLLVESLTRYAVKIAKRFSKGDYDLLMDLIAAGNEGIMAAIDHYDLERCTRLTTYATHWILLHVRQEAQKKTTVTIPVWHRRTTQKIKDIQRKVALDKGRPATTDEIRRRMRIPKKRVEQLLQEDYSYVSTDISPTDHKPYGLQLADGQHEDGEEATQRLEISNMLKELVDTLPKDERMVIRAYFGFDRKGPCSFQDIAVKLGVSRQRVQQVRQIALGKLRKRLVAQLGQDDKSELENRNGSGIKFLLADVLGCE